MLCKRMYVTIVGLIIISLFEMGFGFSAQGAPGENQSSSDAAVAVPYENIRQLVETALTTEADEVKALKARLAALDRYKKTIDITLRAASLQQTAHANLLVEPASDLQNILQAKSDSDAVMTNLSEMMAQARDERAAAATQLARVEEQILLNQKNLATIQEGKSDTPLTAKLIRRIETIDDLLNTEKEMLRKIVDTYETSHENLKAAHDRLSIMKDTFDNAISKKKKEDLFKRGAPGLDAFDITRLDDYIGNLPNRIISKLNNDVQAILDEGRLRITGIILFALIILVIMFQLKRKIIQWEKDNELAKHYPRRHLVLRMASRSIPLGWTAVVLYFFAFVKHRYATIAPLGIGFVVVFIWLWTRWGLDAVSFWNQMVQKKIPDPLALRLRRLMRIVRYFTLTVLFLVWLYGRNSILSTIFNMVFYLILAVWSVRFNHKLNEEISKNVSAAYVKRLTQLAMITIYIIPLGGLIINLSGYQAFSSYWLISWGISLSIALWSWLIFHMIREGHEHFRKTSTSADALTGKNRPFKWFCIQISWLAWFWISLIGLIFAWYVDKTRFFISIVQLMTLSLPLGSLNINLVNLLGIAIVLLVTHVLTRIWPRIFQDKFLADSGMNAGLKNSITVITTYVIWFFGFLMVLNVLGVDSKSMAVAFGGLGIGLGFGLQAIFNNFLSGIILLFERPIQVGDVIEVGGVWGEVKEINVRATLIQTYDNASLLIPNSEFISGQVTNWSFKDFRVRRTINVGVAYGSDVEKVREILFRIAGSIHDVYKYPKPVVLFTDFGDSALLFQLRVWTHVENGLSVETEIRFAVDREFRKHRIEIPFPQRDLHIRSIKTSETSDLESTNPDVDTPAEAPM